MPYPVTACRGKGSVAPFSPASLSGLVFQTSKSGSFFTDAGVTSAAIGQRVGRWVATTGGNLNQTQVAAPDNRLVRASWGLIPPASPNTNECLTFTNVVLTGDFTLYHVSQFHAGGTGEVLKGGGSGRIVNFGAASSVVVFDDAGSTSTSTGWTNTTPKWVRIRRASGSLFLASDGVAEYAGGAGAAGTITLNQLGGNGYSVTDATDGWGATLIYDSSLSAGNRALVEAWLAANEYQ